MTSPARSQLPGKARSRITAWFVDHLRALISSLGQISRNPVGSLLTIAVIGVSLTLPAGFYVFLENARVITAGWQGGAQITAFLHTDISDDQALGLVQEFEALPAVARARFVSRDQALQEYRELSGFAEALDALEDNPLPSLILVEPRLEGDKPEALRLQLQNRAEVDLAILDQKWLQRLFVIIELVERVIYIFSSLLAVAVLLIIGNTIRLGIYNRRQEIEIIKLFGGANSFIQRPFLYSGFWFGFCGSLLAWLLVTVCLQFLKTPINTLAGMYASEFELLGIGLAEGLILLLIGSGLGFLGSWLAVQRHIREIEPA